MDNRKHTTQPSDWWDAFKAAAKAENVSLSEWVGEACKTQLPKRVAAKLSKRVTPGRPGNAEITKTY